MPVTLVLRNTEVELTSDVAREFITDASRAGEGVIEDQELATKYELSIDDLKNLASIKAVQRAIVDERTRRVRSGLAARELASGYFVNAPGQLNKIMMDEKANPRHVIESVRELRMTALPENQNTPANSERFSIVINIGDESLKFDKSIAVDPNDGVPQEVAKPKLPRDYRPQFGASWNFRFFGSVELFRRTEFCKDAFTHRCRARSVSRY
jgi:hypothetical protein